MSLGLDDYRRFVPDLVVRRLMATAGRPSGVDAESFNACLLFADICGFTPLVQRLGLRGDGGVEELNTLLNAYFEPLVDLILAHGGDIVRYAGDGMLVLWRAEGGVGEATERAARCALAIRGAMHAHEVSPGVRLSLRMSLACGPLSCVHAGGVDGEWQLALAGGPLADLRLADQLAAEGEIILSERAAAAASGVHGDLFPNGFLRLSGATSANKASESASIPIPEDVLESLRGFVPLVVRSRLEAGQSRWLADIRHAHIVFVRLRSAESEIASDALQTFTATSQRVLARYEGTLLSVLADDKGTLGMAGFGLPPFMHEDDAARACMAAREICDELSRDSIESCAGIGAGVVFCGPLGAKRRREYSVVGAAVNLAARLMQVAPANEVFCDDATAKAASGQVAIRMLPRFRLKGFDELTVVHRLARGVDAELGDHAELVGRDTERATFDDALAAAREGGSRVILLEGEAGIGKSAVVADLLRAGGELGMSAVLGEASAIERATPFFGWKGVFTRIFELEGVARPAARSRLVLDWLRERGMPLELAPLLNPILDLDLPTNDFLKQLVGRTRAENTDRLLVEIVTRAAADRGLALILDDAHWLDSASWRLAELVARGVHGLCLVFAARPMMDAMPEELSRMLGLERAQRSRMDGLPRESTLELARRRFGCERFAEDVADLLVEQSNGNPFFLKELANHLRDHELVFVESGTCRFQEGGRELAVASVPKRVSSLITSRVDQLPEAERLTLKTASVIGRVFAQRALEAVYDVRSDVPRLGEHIRALNRRELTRTDAVDPELVHAFRHATIQQVTYEQLPLARRQSLHRAIADWYESSAADSSVNAPLLAHHFGRASARDKEIEYLAISGAESLRANANREAIEFLSQALSRAGEPRDAAERERAALWSRQLGEAHFRLSMWSECRLRFEECLELLGRPRARGNVRVAARLARHALSQCLRRLLPYRDFPPSPPPDHADANPKDVEILLACQRLSHVAYFTNDFVGGTAVVFEALSVAERERMGQFAARSYADACIVFKLVPLRPLARMYARLAERASRQSQNLTTLGQSLIETSMFWLGAGRWERVRRQAEECVAIYERLGNQRQLTLAVTVVAMLDCFVARFVESAASFERVLDLGRSTHNSLHEAWGHCGLGECLYRMGRLDDAITRLREAAKILAGRMDRTEEVRAQGLLAVALWRVGRHDEALGHADRARRLIEQSRFTTASTLEGYAGVAEVHLAHLEGDPLSKERISNARRACRSLFHYSRLFPIGLPRAWRLQACLHALGGRAAAARRAWNRSLKEARSRDLPLESALTHLDMAHHLASDAALSREHHLAARQFCQPIGVNLASITAGGRAALDDVA